MFLYKKLCSTSEPVLLKLKYFSTKPVILNHCFGDNKGLKNFFWGFNQFCKFEIFDLMQLICLIELHGIIYLILRNLLQFIGSGHGGMVAEMVAEWSKSQIQVENTVAQVPGSNPDWDLYAILRIKSLQCVMKLWYYPGFQRNRS